MEVVKWLDFFDNTPIENLVKWKKALEELPPTIIKEFGLQSIQGMIERTIVFKEK